MSAVEHGGRRQRGETYVAESGKHPPKSGGCAATQGVDQQRAAGRAEPARSGGEARRTQKKAIQQNKSFVPPLGGL